MTVQEIFYLPAIREIEKNILDLQRDIEIGRCGGAKNEEDVIRSLFKIRKHLLDNEFVMDSEYKRLLVEFNDSLRVQLVKMRNEGIKAYEAVVKAGVEGDAEVIGKCFLGYGYSSIHPIQTIRAKKMWYMLNETLDNYNPHYENGVIDGWGGSTQEIRRRIQRTTCCIWTVVRTIGMTGLSARERNLPMT